MTGLGTWLLALVPTLARKTLASLGFGFVTFIGLQAALDSLLGAVAASSASMLSEVAAIVAIAGFNTALSIVAGALVARVAMMQLKRLVPT